VKDQISAQ